MAQEPRPGYGNPAKINLASEVVDLDLDGGITLVDGTKVMKDLLIAADGVRVCPDHSSFFPQPYSEKTYLRMPFNYQ